MSFGFGKSASTSGDLTIDIRHVPDSHDWFKSHATNRRGRRFDTSLSDLISLVASLGVEGPRQMQRINLVDSMVKIGAGAQFTVFKPDPLDVRSRETNLVVKRVRIPRATVKEEEIGQNKKYAETLRHIELEILALCHPMLRGHRNITKLVAWGYDYEDRLTAIPILFMEAAEMDLSKALESGQPLGDGQSEHIKYDIVRDIAAGLKALHDHNIVHGDIKPQNILLARDDRSSSQWVAKLNDFGLCLDVCGQDEMPQQDYHGTKWWVGPEVGKDPQTFERDYGPFDDPGILFKFDSFSFGLVVLSMFATKGKSPLCDIGSNDDQLPGDVAIELLEKSWSVPSDVRIQLEGALRKLLQPNPKNRALPSPDLFRTEYPGSSSWFQANASCSLDPTIIGYRDHLANRGAGFWGRLDRNLLDQLYHQHIRSTDNGALIRSFSGETLFGMSQRFAILEEPLDRAKFLRCLRDSSVAGYDPAQSICSIVFSALGENLHVREETLRTWQKNALSQGYLFAADETPLSDDEKKAQRCRFHDGGGYCRDPFLKDREVQGVAQNPETVRQWIEKNGFYSAVDYEGNQMTHVCAALGRIESLEYLLGRPEYCPGRVNNKNETALYKAYQSGNTRAVKTLVAQAEKVHHASGPNICPFHWLVAFAEGEIPEVATLLVENSTCKGDCTIVPEKTKEGDSRPIEALHFPFYWPFGTPLHWAAFARNRTAMETLIRLGVAVDPTYHCGDMTTTPLAQAIFYRDDMTVSFLLSHGAKTNVVDGKGRNLLHMLSHDFGRPAYPDNKLHAWVRNGPWENRFRATCSIVSALVEAGVEINSRPDAWDGRTPLLSSTELSSFHACAALALFSAGADPDIASSESNETALHGIAKLDKRKLPYPGGYDQLFKLAVQNTKDLQRLGSSNVRAKTVLHELASTQDDIEQFKSKLKTLAHQLVGPIKLDALDGMGSTALMITLESDNEPAARSQALLDLGADPKVMNAERKNIITSLASNVNLMDCSTRALLENLLQACNFTIGQRDDFIDGTSVEALIMVCQQSKLTTLQVMLELGFNKRMNESIPRRMGRPLDEAFRHASGVRYSFLSRVARYLKNDKEFEEAEKLGYLYDNTAIGTITPAARARIARAKEVYWTFPALLRLLLDNGAERDLTQDDGEASLDFIDNARLPQLGYTVSTQPNKAHWDILYRLQRPPDGCEKRVEETVRIMYEADLVPPTILEYERWPWLFDLIGEDGDGWYETQLKFGIRAWAQFEKGKLHKIRDREGKSLPSGAHRSPSGT